MKFYPIATPILNGNEKKYVMDCLTSNWISSNGKYIDQFEHQFAAFCNTKHAISCNNGTTALHLALLGHGVGEGDEVIIPTLTFVATANAVTYCGAKPVFVDVDQETWNIDPEQISKKITSKTKGIIVVHLYGHPCDMDPILDLATKNNLFVIEDAAEALGAKYKQKMVGSLGDSSIFSLFGNKVITTGEGGMITTDNDQMAEKIRLLKGQGMDLKRRYWHPVIGYNYRMTNIQAAIGCGQLENIKWHIDQRIRVANKYIEYLNGCDIITLPVEKKWAFNIFWMFGVIVQGCSASARDQLMGLLKKAGIETRPFFYPMHILPPYRDLQSISEFMVANDICSSGILLPTHANLQDRDIKYISYTFLTLLKELKQKGC